MVADASRFPASVSPAVDVSRARRARDARGRFARPVPTRAAPPALLVNAAEEPVVFRLPEVASVNWRMLLDTTSGGRGPRLPGGSEWTMEGRSLALLAVEHEEVA